jgi:glutamate synthase (NADPH/NADH) small chain
MIMSAPDSNSKYAWREVAPKGPPQRSVKERVSDFLEVYGIFDEETAREQASRCIQCPNPTCVQGCPLCNPIPQWMQLTAEGRFLEAAGVVGSVTNLAEICTRCCPSDRLCEHQCILDGITEPVAINAIEQFLIEYAFKHGQVNVATPPPNGFKVAIVGSGPGGLAAAEELAGKGYAVTVFDAGVLPGGLLVDGTPTFRVERSIVQRRIDILKKRGVVFQLGRKLGADLSLSDLRSSFNAVFLGFDSRKSHPLEIPGAGLTGVVQALPFLLQKTTPVSLNFPAIDLTGKRVVVIGAGDTAMDCLRAAIRWGAKEATCVYRREETEMPCGRHAYQDAIDEGARFNFRSQPIAILGKESVTGIRLIRTEPTSADASGRRVFQPVPGSEYEMEVDWVVPALGFDPIPCPHHEDLSALTTNDWGGIVVDNKMMTSVEGVFASGDIVNGPAMLLNTVRDARKTAQCIHAYLSAKTAAKSS